jgi:predicted alpha/beta hydrolase
MDELIENQNVYYSAAITITLAWIFAGEPMNSPCDKFTLWDKWCRQPLLWLNQSDPLVKGF